jgi:hypothetical protein
MEAAGKNEKWTEAVLGNSSDQYDLPRHILPAKTYPSGRRPSQSNRVQAEKTSGASLDLGPCRIPEQIPPNPTKSHQISP